MICDVPVAVLGLAWRVPVCGQQMGHQGQQQAERGDAPGGGGPAAGAGQHAHGAADFERGLLQVDIEHVCALQRGLGFGAGFLLGLAGDGKLALQAQLARAAEEGAALRQVAQALGEVGEGQAMAGQVIDQFAARGVGLAGLGGAEHGQQLVEPADEGRVTERVGF